MDRNQAITSPWRGTSYTAHRPNCAQCVSINNRHPLTITYRFSVLGRKFEGKTTTPRTPGHQQQSGQPVYVFYLEKDPTQNTIYPPVM
jgi:hypothetical protein